MPTAVPHSVRNAFGEEVADDLSQWVRTEIREQAVPRDEYREVLSRLDVVEREIELRFKEVDNRLDAVNDRLDRMDERFNQMDQRFDAMNKRFDQMNAQFNERTDGMNKRFDEMHRQMRVQTRWTVGAIVIIGTIMTTLLAIAEFAA